MGRLITTLLLTLALATQAQAFDFGLGFGFGGGGSGLPTLPALSAQALYLPFEDSIGAGTTIGTYTTGKQGKALLVSTGQSASYPTAGVLTATSGTVAMWVNLNTTKVGGGDVFALFDHRGGGNTGNDNIILYGSTNAITANTTNHTGTSSANTIVGALTGLSGWHHLAMTWDSTKLAVWRDGVELAGSVSSPNIPTTLHTDFKIGYDAAAAGWQPSMPIDNLRVYNRALVASEMMKLYNLGR